MHAGGFDARDDLDSMVPSAADGTDYEELLTEAMDYEDTGKADSYPDSRPGVGATDKQIHIRGGSMIAKVMTMTRCNTFLDVPKSCAGFGVHQS